MSILARAKALRAQIESNAAVMPDEEAVQFVELFPNWSPNGVSYTTDTRVRYNGVLYRVLQDHVSQEEWTPTAAASLFAKVLIPDENVIPEWEQPDSTNPYMAGDTVTHNGQTWTSDVDNNVWEPSVYGWTAVTA